MEHDRDSIIVSPGPVNVFPAVSEGLPKLHHRSEEFRNVVRESVRLLRELVRTSSAVHLLTSSGTGAMEAAVANLTIPGSRVLVVSGGKFGERWGEIADAHECRTARLIFEKGEAIDAGAVAEKIGRERPDAVFVTHVESSTGLLFPLKELCALLAGKAPLFVVDAISSLGAEELDMDAWGIDAVVGASQKSLAAPAGMSFIALSRRALERVGRRAKGTYYFDLARAGKAFEAGDTPFTPAIETVQVIHRSLAAMSGLGFDRVLARHQAASVAFCAAAGHLSLESFPERPSSAVQVLTLPPVCRGKGLLAELARRGFIAADGQGDLKGAVIRTGFLGLFGVRTLERLVEALGAALDKQGCGVDLPAALTRMRKYGFDAPLFG